MNKCRELWEAIQEMYVQFEISDEAYKKLSKIYLKLVKEDANEKTKPR